MKYKCKACGYVGTAEEMKAHCFHKMLVGTWQENSRPEGEPEPVYEEPYIAQGKLLVPNLKHKTEGNL